MKTALGFILTLILIVSLSGCFFENVSFLYSQHRNQDGLDIVINPTARCCFAGPYTCTEYTQNQQITIPDAYEKTPITRLGGYYGRGNSTPFFIDISEIYINAPEDSVYHHSFCGDLNSFPISEDNTVEAVVFNLNIGKNIEVIGVVDMRVYYPHVNEDGTVTLYHPVVHVTCAEENKYFYSENGKLYDKKTNELISVFEYAA